MPKVIAKNVTLDQFGINLKLMTKTDRNCRAFDDFDRAGHRYGAPKVIAKSVTFDQFGIN